MREYKKEEDMERKETFFGKKENLSLFGLLLGYIVCIAICWIVQGKSVKVNFKLFRNFTDAVNMHIGQSEGLHS